MEIKVKTNGAKLTEGESINSKPLKTFDRGDVLTFLEVSVSSISSSPRFKAEFEGITGYISSYFVEVSPEIDKEIARLKELISIQKEEDLRKYDSLKKVKEKERQEYRDSWEDREKEQIRKNDSIAESMLRSAKEESKAYFEIRKKASEADQKARREKFIKKYGQTNGEKIAKKLIWIGMTEEMLIDSWGNPQDINSTVTRYGSEKQYDYGGGQYVYVENGKVDAWQN
ncbi:hypothetical protein U3A59_12915 [Algoriphagus sp. E1-3-M2]|nr:hypothetical protein [Algoriphagus sp. E1-3-M2]